MKTIKYLILFTFLFFACEEEQTLIKVVSEIEYMSHVRLYYYNTTNDLPAIKIIDFYLESYDKKTFDAKPGDHAYTYGYYPLDPGEIYDGEPMIMFSENFNLAKGETYTIIIE